MQRFVQSLLCAPSLQSKLGCAQLKCNSDIYWPIILISMGCKLQAVKPQAAWRIAVLKYTLKGYVYFLSWLYFCFAENIINHVTLVFYLLCEWDYVFAYLLQLQESYLVLGNYFKLLAGGEQNQFIISAQEQHCERLIIFLLFFTVHDMFSVRIFFF